MTKAIEFLFDFGSPNAYLVHKVVPELEARIGDKVVYQPILLGGLFKLTNNKPPMMAFADVPAKMAYMKLEMKRFVAANKLDAYRFNSHFPVNTLHLMRGVFAARELGVFEPYRDAVFAAMWEQGLEMSEVPVIRGALEAAGLPAEAIIAKTQEQGVKDALQAATAAAHARGAFGSPTFFVGDEMFFGKERLAAVETEFLRSREG